MLIKAVDSLNQQIKPHLTRWHYPLITYLSCAAINQFFCHNWPNLGASLTQCHTGSWRLQSCNKSDNQWNIGFPNYVDFGIWKKLHLVQFFCSFEQLKNSWHFEWPVTECSWVGSFTYQHNQQISQIRSDDITPW